MVRDRLKKSSVSIIAILLILILIVLPTGYEDAAIYKGTDRVRAKVISTDESSVINNGLIQSGEECGRSPYHPKMMLKVILYAYMNNIYSCRKKQLLKDR